MTNPKQRLLRLLLGAFLILPTQAAFAGGSVDTSVDRFLSADFTNSELITNPWWTLPEGRNFLYFALDGEDCAWSLQQVMGTTSDLGGDFVGPYAGTNARVVLDRGWLDEGCVYGDDFQAFIASNPETEESTYDWFAQDGEQNIWYMGEDTFDGDTEGSFVAGCDGAEAGIVVLGQPFKGASYSQEFYEDQAEDQAKVLNFKPVDDLTCMTTKEWTPLERGAIEHKTYCSDGVTGELTHNEELQGKTVHVELVDTNVMAPPAVGLPVSPIPSCP